MSTATGFFFHGTHADLEIGDTILTGMDTGNDHGRSQHVYMTHAASTHPESTEYTEAVADAYSWARAACAVAAERNDDEDVEAFVYMVAPVGEVETDEEDGAGVNTVRTAGYARIVGVVDAYDLEALLPAGFVGNTFLNL